MNTRRTFFKSLAKAAAIVALAPQLCFRQKLELPVLLFPAWKDGTSPLLDELFASVRKIIQERIAAGEERVAWVSRGNDEGYWIP